MQDKGGCGGVGLGGGDPIIFNNKECHIKGKTSAALHNCGLYEIRFGTKRHIGMHDFYQFNYWNLNLRQCEGEGMERGDSTQRRLLSFFLCVWIALVKAISNAGQKLHQNVAHVSTTSGSGIGDNTPSREWRRVIRRRPVLADQLQFFINFSGQFISHRGE